MRVVRFEEVDGISTGKGAPEDNVVWVEHVFGSRSLVVKMVSHCILRFHEG